MKNCDKKGEKLEKKLSDKYDPNKAERDLDAPKRPPSYVPAMHSSIARCVCTNIGTVYTRVRGGKKRWKAQRGGCYTRIKKNKTEDKRVLFIF